jgi:hypothetical protein
MIKVRLNKGFAIMLVLMMLFLLFMLGVAFFFSAWTHAFMARNYLNMKRAFVVAEGGVWHAIGNIIGDFSWVMHAQNKGVNARSNLGWEWGWYRGTEAGDFRIPPEYATHPSYAMLVEESRTQGCICSTGGNPCPTPSCDCTMGQRLCPGKTTALYEPKKITILGQEVGLSGVMDAGGGAYGINSDIFHLKVNECSAQLYVNEGLGHPYNTAVMQRILNNLGQALEPKIDGLGDTVIDNRPTDGYKTKAELKAILKDKLDYDRVKDFLCVHTWSDNQVCNPVPLSLDAASAYDDKLYQTRPGYPDNTITRYGRGRINDQSSYPLNQEPLDFGSFVYAWQELNPCYIEITSRAPVNINTAPKEIIVALLTDLQGFYVMQTFAKSESWVNSIYHWWNFSDTNDQIYRFSTTYSGPGEPGQIGTIYKTPSISMENAKQIAESIIANRPFYTWRDFNCFLDELVWELDKEDVPINNTDFSYTGTWESMVHKRYASLAIADTIKANFNPNLHLNELNPDANIWQWVDKTDLIKNSTEFCFLPTGYFEIESVGQILRAEWEGGRFHISPYLMIMKDSFTHNNQIMGQRRLTVEVKLWDIYRETTQGDFMMGQFSDSIDVPYRTNMNLGCLSGPEPLNGYAPFDNSYEGYVCLSTVGGSMPKSQHWQKGKLYRTSEFKQEENLHEEGASIQQCPTCSGTGNCQECSATGGAPCLCVQNNWSFMQCQGGWWNCWWCGCNNTEVITCPECGGSGNCPDCEGAGKIPHMHAHYDFDFTLHGSVAHYHPLTESPLPGDPQTGGIWGLADWTEREYEHSYRSPYCNAYNPGRYRICRDKRDFRGDLFAPTDQRIDGFYAEMYDYLPYYSRHGNFDKYKGAITYWIKPNFFPELDARIKFFSSISRGGWYSNNPYYMNHAKFMHIFGWMNGLMEDSPIRAAGSYIRPYSMYFQVDAPVVSPSDGMPADHPWQEAVLSMQGANTPTLNHVYHNYAGPGWDSHALSPHNLFMAHRWIHVAIVWRNREWLEGDMNIFVNGEPLPGTGIIIDRHELTNHIPDYTTTSPGGSQPKLNPLILGSSRWSQRSASSTLDEFYLYGNVEEYEVQVPKPCPECGGTTIVECSKCSATCLYCTQLLACGSNDFKCRTIACGLCECSGTCAQMGACASIDYKCFYGYKCWDCHVSKCTSGGCPQLGDCSGNNYHCVERKCWKTCGEECYGCSNLTACKNAGYYCTCPKCEGEGYIIVNELRIAPPEKAINDYRFGRYYRQNNAVFTSKEIDLIRIMEREAPEPNLIKDPYGRDRWRGNEGLSEDDAGEWLKQTWYHPKVKILGITWTGYTHDISDYSQVDNPLLPVQLEVSLEIKDGEGNWVQVAGPFLNLDSSLAPVFVKLLRDYPQIRYRVRFNTRCDPTTVLLETPILDDVTIYYMTRPEFVSWVESH